MEKGKLLINDYFDKYDANKYIKVYENMIIAKGGDGTLLKAIKLYKGLNKPFYGLNAGTIGFLMNEKSPNKYKNLEVKTFNLIKVKITHQVEDDQAWHVKDMFYTTTSEYQAFNEICFGGNMNSWINFKVKEEDNFFGEVDGGGLIISTAQGSTGINKNNKGVILPLSSDLWSITGDKTSRKIEHVVKPRDMKISAKSRTGVTVWVDGANNIISNVSKIKISKGDEVQVIFGDYDSFKKKRRI